MKEFFQQPFKLGLMIGLPCLGLGLAFVLWASHRPALAEVPGPPEESEAREGSSDSDRSDEEASEGSQESDDGQEAEEASDESRSPDAHSEEPRQAPRAGEGPDGANAERRPPPSAGAGSEADGDGPAEAGANEAEEIVVSFEKAKIDDVIQWLAETTDKSIIKHPQVQCELTIISSQKLPRREAIGLVYRALAMEGFTANEFSNSIIIVPEGEAAKIRPQMMGGSQTGVPDGRQRVVKVFEPTHIEATELKEKVRGVLSEDVKIEADERANKLIVTDRSENVQLLSELIRELDVVPASESVIRIFDLEHIEPGRLVDLLDTMLNRRTNNSNSSGPDGSGPGGRNGDGDDRSQRRIRFWPDEVASRLIVTAPRSRISEVEDLLDTLDTPQDKDLGVRVLPLENVNAVDLANELGPLYESMSGESRRHTIEISSNDRSNSLIILSNLANFEAIQKLVTELDVETAQEKVMRAFVLENADAEDVAEQLQELQSPQTSTSSRYFYYYSRSGDDSDRMSVVADRRRNTVIVQAPPESMGGIEQMIRELDQPVPQDELAPRVFPLEYVSAVNLEEVLRELFLQEDQQRTYWSYYYSSQDSDEGAGRLFGKVRLTSEPYSNSIIVTANSQENLNVIAGVIEQLDSPSEASETTMRVELEFAHAAKLASRLNILFAGDGAPPLDRDRQQGNQGNQGGQGQQPQEEDGISSQRNFTLTKEAEYGTYYPWLGGRGGGNGSGPGGGSFSSRLGGGQEMDRPISDLIGRVRAVPDRRSNSLLVTSNVHFFPQIMSLVNELDAPTPQVLIEARILEVSSDFRERLGVRWSPDGERTFDQEDFDNSLMPSAAAEFRKIFAGSEMANALETGVLESSINLDFVIQFLRKTTGSRILAEPQVNVADNEVGRLFVGAQVPFISRSSFTPQGGRNDSFTYRDVGVILEVTPRIHNSEDVALKINTESSNIRAGETLFGGAILDTRNFRTDLVVESGQTIVLGGIIQQEEVDTVRKVPLLGDIPGLGWLFKKKDTQTRDVELMVFLQPRITRGPQEVEKLLDNVERRMPRIQQWEEENRSLEQRRDP